MKVLLAILVLMASQVWAEPPTNPDLFQAGVYGDDDLLVTCLTGPAGAEFQQVLWAWVPDDLGLAYITLRFDFPNNLDLSSSPDFSPSVVDVIITDYPGGTVEWNMIIEGCPSGWVKVFSQECVLLDDQPSQIRILPEHSMMRDCTFVLNDLSVLNNFLLNDPQCDNVPASNHVWDQVKSFFR